MAERSTAAVDVAAGGGDKPAPAKAGRATTDGVTREPEQDTPGEAANGADPASGSDSAAGEPPDTPADEASEASSKASPAGPGAPAGTDEAKDAAAEARPGGTPAQTPEKPAVASAEDTPADEAPEGAAPGDGSGDDAPGDGSGDDVSGDDGPRGDVSEGSVPEDESTGDAAPANGAFEGASEAEDPEADAGQNAPSRADTTEGTPSPGDTTEGAPSRADAAGDAPSGPAGSEPTLSADEASADDASADSASEAVASEVAPVTPPAPELHSGYKLAERYRLEECVTRLDGFSSWRAVDEKLRRAVGVHLLGADHPRARSVLAAARSSALLGDPRFVQVLDAVEENDLVYVVQEWLPDATELTALLASGPLEAHDAYQLVSQVTQAMTAAHREGLAHLRLTPGAVLRTSSGQWRVRGLAVNAALRGITSATPQRTDTEAIGALLYAALTQRWPYDRDAHGLPGLPKGVGLIAPDQVRAGVHRGLSELAIRALVNDGATASRQDPPCTTPEELLAAINALPRIRRPEPTFSAPPQYRRTTYQQGVYRRTPTGGPGAPTVVEVPPPPLQSRTGRALKWGVSALLVVALGLGSWQLADALLERGNESGKPGPSNTVGGSGKKPLPVGKPLEIVDASEFAPIGGTIKENQVPLTVDGKRDTAWVTPQYRGFARFGNLSSRKDGSGIIVDLGSVREVSGFDIDLYRSGQELEIRAADADASGPVSLSDFPQRLTKLATVGQRVQENLGKAVRTRYVLVHITSLPPDGSQSQFRGGISEIKVLGRPAE